MYLFPAFRNAVNCFGWDLRSIPKKNRNFPTFDRLAHGKLQCLAIKILYQWIVNLKVINSNFYFLCRYLCLLYFAMWKKITIHNLTNLSHFLCNSCTFDMVHTKHTRKKWKEISLQKFWFVRFAKLLVHQHETFNIILCSCLWIGNLCDSVILGIL